MDWTIEAGAGKRVIDLDGLGELHVAMVSGDLLVAGTPGPSRLEVECIEGEPVEVSFAGGLLLVEHRQTTSGLGVCRRTRAAVSVYCPPGTRVSARSVSAPVVVAGIAGELRSATVSGDITWSFVGGEVKARSVSGRVEMEGVSGRLDVSTVSGDVDLAGGNLEALTAQSTSGDLTLDVESRPEGSYRCSTVSGDVVLRLPADADATVEASTLSGRVAVPDNAERVQGRRRPGFRKVRSQLGSGGADVSLRSVSGALAVVTRSMAVAV